ncbi:hypothetical protein EUGRSUZ_B01143 [Eucalyptus grandis]|uniref:Uncharacterized protein n=2 Tax=Eucalyptus grandis TaxID=71139 RepID=A0ACC3LPT1_EUCGR|nr:hypothetical protein EUGRSUZ_B01143 [Eucalyptus grandis]
MIGCSGDAAKTSPPTVTPCLYIFQRCRHLDLFLSSRPNCFSDHEYRATLTETATLIDLASTMIKEGQGSELMPKEADESSPITANRFYSLCAYICEDDVFSSDLTDDQLRMRLGNMCNTPCQVIFSMADEYVPAYVDKKSLVERLCKALGGAETVEIEHGNHSLSNRVSEAVQAIVDFVKRDGPKGWDDPWN